MTKNIYPRIIFIVLAILISGGYVKADITDGIVAYWACDNSFNDNSSKGINLTQSGGALNNVGGKINTACYTDGVNDIITELNNTALSFEYNNTFSVCLWINTNSTTSTTPDASEENRFLNDYSSTAKGWFFQIDGTTTSFKMYAGAGSVRSASYATSYAGAGWQYICAVTNSTATALYINGTLVASDNTTPNSIKTNNVAIQLGYRSTKFFKNTYDEIVIYNRTINSSEMIYLMSTNPFNINESGDVINFVSSTPSNNTINFINNNSIIITVNVSVTNYSNTTIRFYYDNGTLRNSNLSTSNTTELYISSLSPGIYFYNATALNTTGGDISTTTRKITIYNLTAGNILIPSLNQSVNASMNITFTNSTTTNNSVAIINYSIQLLNNDTTVNRTIANITGNNYSWTTYPENLSIGYYYILVMAKDAQNNTVNQTQPFNLTANSNLTINATYARDLTQIIGNFSINVTDLNGSYVGNFSTGAVNTALTFNTIRGHTYNIFIDALNYAYSYANVTHSSNITDYYQFLLYTTNSIQLNIYDESTSNLITQNITVVLSGNGSDLTYYTANGSLYIDNITDGNYTLKASGANYTLRTYNVVMQNRSTQTLNIYLTANTEDVIFSLLDRDDGTVIEGATMTQYRQINGTWTTIQTKTSDITGRAQFSFLPSIKYRFIITSSGYTSKTFDLDPIIFTSYNVLLTKSAAFNGSMDFTGVNIYYTPTKFFRNQNNSWVWSIQSEGYLLYYNYSLTWPCGSYNYSGNNTDGGYSNYTFNLTCGGWTDKVKLYYQYAASVGGLKNYTLYFEIVPAFTGNYTITENNKGNKYGLGILERVIVVSIIVIFLIGAVTLVTGSSFLGAFLGTLFYALAVSIELVPLWSVLISILAGIFFIIFNSGRG